MRTFLLVVTLALLMLLCGASFVVRAKGAAPTSDRCVYSACEDSRSPRSAAPVSAALQRGRLPVPSPLILLSAGIVVLRAGLAIRRE